MTAGADTQTIVRALRVMEVLNERPVTSVSVLHETTGLPKATITRILSTLVNAGYVVKVSRRDGYMLTEKILRLSAGFKYSDAIVDAARPWLDDFTREHKWQLSLATRDFNAMRFRYNTRHASPFAPDLQYLNQRVLMLGSAVGRAYLAYCADVERVAILAMLHSQGIERQIEGDATSIDALLDDIRRKRYATVSRPPDTRIRYRSLAIPIVSERSGEALASMLMSYYASTMTEVEAARLFLEKLYQVAGRIVSALDGLEGDAPAADIDACAHAVVEGGDNRAG